MFLFEYQNATLPMMHLKQERCLQSAGLLRDYIVSLPKYMNPWACRNKLPGTKSLKYDEHHTAIAILAQSDSKEKARDALRGYTSAAGMFEEFEYLQHFADVMEGGGPAIISARNIIREHGGRTCIMMLSTPGDLETDTGRDAQRMIDATPKFNEHFYDFTEEELKALFDSVTLPNGEVREPITGFYIEFNYKQLRKDDRWLQQQYDELVTKLGRTDEYRRGVLLQRYRGSGAVLFEQADIDYIKNNVREPDHTITILKKYDLYVYNHQIKFPDLNSDTPYFDTTIPYLIGIDIASGSEGDNTTFCVVNPYTMEVVGELISPYIGALDLMRLITEFAKLIPRGIFCPETNSIGKAIVDFVQESQLEPRFYHDPQLDISKNAIRKDDPIDIVMKKKAAAKQYIGTYVTPQIRQNMFHLLSRQVKDYKSLLNTKYVVQDIVNLVRGKNGKIAAASGCHDDMIMAYLHTLYVLTYGKDLTRFGIDKHLCTFEKVLDVLKDYDDAISAETVNNVVPYDDPYAFENQLLADKLSQNENEYSYSGGVDIYGYSRSQYNNSGIQHRQQSQLESLSSSDVAFFNDINNTLIGI